MYEIEGEIKKSTIINFVKIIKKSPNLSIRNIEIMAEELCIGIDKEVNKEDDDDIFR